MLEFVSILLIFDAKKIARNEPKRFEKRIRFMNNYKGKQPYPYTPGQDLKFICMGMYIIIWPILICGLLLLLLIGTLQ